MEATSQSSSQQNLWKDVENGKERKVKYSSYQRVALVLALLFLLLALSVFSLRYLWGPTLGKAVITLTWHKNVLMAARPMNIKLMDPGFSFNGVLKEKTLTGFSVRQWEGTSQGEKSLLKTEYNSGTVYDHQYKAVLDGVEKDSTMEIDPDQRVEIFRMGNGSEEVVEVHDFKNGITGIRFTEHQRCYIRTQTKKLPTVAEVETEDAELLVFASSVDEATDVKVEESQVWVPAEEPIVNPDFLLNSKIWEVCQQLPIHWIHPSPLSDTEAENVDTPDAEPVGRQRLPRDVLDHLPVNDYSEVGIQLDSRLDDRGYCCQYCRRGYRYCRRYHEPLRGFNPWPYYYQGGRTICQIVMPCNWWIARMLGRI